MSSTIPAVPAAAYVPAHTHSKPSAPPADSAPRPAEHHPAPALSPSDVSYVDSLMGYTPAQAMEYIMLKTGVPMPENLGQDIDTSV